MVQEIDTAPGVYPVVWSVNEPRKHRQRPGASGDPTRAPPGNAKDQSEAGRTDRLRSTQVVQDFIRDEEASISLWTIPLDHACVPESERSGMAQDSDSDLDSDSNEELQTASYHNKHAPRHDSEGVWASKAIRVALDFSTPDGRPMRRTGTVLLRGQEPTTWPSDSCGFDGLGVMGWSVRWDSWQSFARAQVSLIVPTGILLSSLESGSGSSSDPIEVQDAESRFVVLVWKQKVSNLNVERLNGSVDESIVTMIFKKQDCGQCQPVQFTKEEKQAFGIGLSDEHGFGISTVP